MRHRGRDRGWFFIRKGETSAPSLFISRGNRGISFPLAGCCYSFFTNSAAPPFFSKPREQRSALPIATSITTPSTFSITSAMAPKADKGKGVKSAKAQRLVALRKERAIFSPQLSVKELREYFYLFWATETRAHPRTRVLQIGRAHV